MNDFRLHVKATFSSRIAAYGYSCGLAGVFCDKPEGRTDYHLKNRFTMPGYLPCICPRQEGENAQSARGEVVSASRSLPDIINHISSHFHP